MTKWWESAVVYQIYPRSWADGNGDGVGDFAGITQRLDYLVEVLTVDALWVSPFYPSPQADFGYDVSDYCGVDPLFGDLDSFKVFLAGCHQRSIKVIVDWVPNHSSDRHAWFEESRASRDNPKRDWYVWRDPAPDGGLPNNWRSLFGGPAWALDETTGQYYLHSFLAAQPDLNWRNPDLEAAMLDGLRFWLDLGVDGFRIDVAHRCLKDPRLRDNPPARRLPTGYKIDPEYAAFEHIYDSAHPDIHLLFRKIRALVDEYEAVSPRFTVGEIHESEPRIWAGYYGWNLDELHMPFNFSLLEVGMDPLAFRHAVESIEAALPSGAWPNWVFGNHDEPRIATRLGWHQSRLAALLLLTLRGTPTIYYGDELGLPNIDIPPGEQQDPWGHQPPGFGRDGCRTPMQWSAGPMAGFTDGATSWLPIGGQETLSVEAQLGDKASHLELYRRLLATRRDHRALQIGDITFSGSWDSAVIRFERTGAAGDPVFVVANMSETGATVRLDRWRDLTIVAGTDASRWDSSVSQALSLAPWEGVVLA